MLHRTQPLCPRSRASRVGSGARGRPLSTAGGYLGSGLTGLYRGTARTAAVARRWALAPFQLRTLLARPPAVSSLARPPPPPLATSPAQPSALRAHVDAVLSAIERPAVDGFAFAKVVVLVGFTLTVASAQVVGEAYRQYVHYRLRRLLRFAIGTPFLLIMAYLTVMMYYYFPEGPRTLDTSSVAGLPLCETVDDLLQLTLELRSQYHRALRRCAEAGKGGRRSPSQSLTLEEKNQMVRGLLVILRSMETVLIGSDEERALIELHPDLLASWHRGLASKAVSRAGVGVGAGAADASTPPTGAATGPRGGRRSSPAEFVLRVVLAVAMDQGWFDIAEHARTLYNDLVRTAPAPVQSNVVQAVGDLCVLSYELENFTAGCALTTEQRRRVARAIDTFRPERAVQERCTIASEITVLPLSDGDATTRCLGMIRHSPGRKPQLVICFVGSNSRRNWMTNFNFLPVPLPPDFGVAGGARVHRGFLALVRSIGYQKMAEDFDQIILVGHSLGGALAYLAGLHLAAERPSRRITVITMASPRVLSVDVEAHKKRAAEKAAAKLAAAAGAAGSGEVAGESSEAAAVAPPPPTPASVPLASLLRLPANYHHFRGYVRADVVPKLPPEYGFHFTHVGSRIPLNTGCATPASFLGWGLWTIMFHKSEFYGRLLRDPDVAQTHRYRPSAQERERQRLLRVPLPHLHRPAADAIEDEDEDEVYERLRTAAMVA